MKNLTQACRGSDSYGGGCSTSVCDDVAADTGEQGHLEQHVDGVARGSSGRTSMSTRAQQHNAYDGTSKDPGGVANAAHSLMTCTKLGLPRVPGISGSSKDRQKVTTKHVKSSESRISELSKYGSKHSWQTKSVYEA